jgi:flagellar hook-associated protein 3 FlgL
MIATRLYDRATASFTSLNGKAEQLFEQVSGGKRIRTASDDALGYQRLAKLKVAGADSDAYTGNLKIAAAVLGQADTALGAINDQLQRAAELTLQAQNGTLSASDRRVLGEQIAGIRDTIAGLANATDLRGQPLFGQASAIPIGEGQSVQANETRARAFGFAGKGGDTDAFAALDAVVAALALGEAPGEDQLADVKAAGTQVTDIQASLGARAARVELVQAQVADAALDREDARAGIEDVDPSAAITELQKTLTVLQATQASFSKLQALSLFDYLR